MIVTIATQMLYCGYLRIEIEVVLEDHALQLFPYLPLDEYRHTSHRRIRKRHRCILC